MIKKNSDTVKKFMEATKKDMNMRLIIQVKQLKSYMRMHCQIQI